MNSKAVIYILLLVIMLSAKVFSQNTSLPANKDSTLKEKPSSKISVLVYERVILNNTGAISGNHFMCAKQYTIYFN